MAYTVPRPKLTFRERIYLPTIIAGLLIARCMSISEDTDDDAAIERIKQASEPMTMDQAYMTREVRRVRGLS